MSCEYYGYCERYCDQDLGTGNEAGYYDDFGNACSPSSGGGGGGGGYGGGGGGYGGGGGTVTIQPSGGQINTGIFSQTLQGILSGIALFQHQPYVPTTIQPQQHVQQYPVGVNGLPITNNSSGNTLGNVQTFIQRNSGAVLLAVVGFGLFMLRPPSRAR